MIAPLAPSLPPPEVGGAYDAPESPVQKFSALLCTGKPALSQPGRLSGGGMARVLQVTQNDFSRAIFFESAHIRKSLNQVDLGFCRFNGKFSATGIKEWLLSALCALHTHGQNLQASFPGLHG
jgi:hypothetical protein